jgi:hypothetical protein
MAKSLTYPAFRAYIGSGNDLLHHAVDDDHANLDAQFAVYDALYAWCRLQVARGESSGQTGFHRDLDRFQST